MAIQSTYATKMATAYAGMIVNTEPNVLISREVESAAVGFGKAVKQGTGDAQVIAATAAVDVVRGITVRDQSTTDDKFAVADSALVITKGVIWVTALDTVVAGAPVYMVVAGGSGKFTDTTTSNLAIPGAIFETSGAADDLVAIRLG